LISSWGGGVYHGQIARPLEGGFVGRALHSPAQRAALGPLDALLDSSLIHATIPVLRHAAAVPVRLVTELGGHLIAVFTTAPRDRVLMLWGGESYAAVIALCSHGAGTLDGLIAAAQRDGLTGCLRWWGRRFSAGL
jgi:hypothetical protein